MPWFNYGGIFLGKMFDFQMANYNFFQFLPKMQIFPKTLRDTFLEALEVTFTVSHSVIQSFGHSVIRSFSQIICFIAEIFLSSKFLLRGTVHLLVKTPPCYC